jgi:hypothetical protein
MVARLLIYFDFMTRGVPTSWLTEKNDDLQ